MTYAHILIVGSSFDVVYNLLEKVTADLSDYDSMIVCIQSYLDSTQSTCNDTQRTCNDTQSSIRSVSVVCARLSHSLNPHTFTQSFIEKVTENIDEHQLFKVDMIISKCNSDIIYINITGAVYYFSCLTCCWWIAGTSALRLTLSE